MYKNFAVYIVVFAAAYCGVKLFRNWSVRREMFDVPNERSSHTIPTPRGGGLIICAVSMIALLFYVFCENDAVNPVYFAGAMIVALISLVDDIRAVSPLVRIICHCLAAGITVWGLGGFKSLLIPFYGIVELDGGGDFLAFFWIVWLINAYNFMDGIDGIAATQSITAGTGWVLTGLLLGVEAIGFYGGVLAAASLGFIILNWQPAKIFMGDVGSAFLGYSFAVLPLLALNKIENITFAPILPWIAVILVWFFVFDSVYTFFRRLLRGAKVWRPHREHIYQNMVISGLSHADVTALYGTASIGLIIVLWATLNYRWEFEKTVFAAVLSETVLLMLVWQIVCRRAGDSNLQK